MLRSRYQLSFLTARDVVFHLQLWVVINSLPDWEIRDAAGVSLLRYHLRCLVWQLTNHLKKLALAASNVDLCGIVKTHFFANVNMSVCTDLTFEFNSVLVWAIWYFRSSWSESDLFPQASVPALRCSCRSSFKWNYCWPLLWKLCGGKNSWKFKIWKTINLSVNFFSKTSIFEHLCVPAIIPGASIHVEVVDFVGDYCYQGCLYFSSSKYLITVGEKGSEKLWESEKNEKKCTVFLFIPHMRPGSFPRMNTDSQFPGIWMRTAIAFIFFHFFPILQSKLMCVNVQDIHDNLWQCWELCRYFTLYGGSNLFGLTYCGLLIQTPGQMDLGV